MKKKTERCFMSQPELLTDQLANRAERHCIIWAGYLSTTFFTHRLKMTFTMPATKEHTEEGHIFQFKIRTGHTWNSQASAP